MRLSGAHGLRGQEREAARQHSPIVFSSDLLEEEEKVPEGRLPPSRSFLTYLGMCAGRTGYYPFGSYFQLRILEQTLDLSVSLAKPKSFLIP